MKQWKTHRKTDQHDKGINCRMRKLINQIEINPIYTQTYLKCHWGNLGSIPNLVNTYLYMCVTCQVLTSGIPNIWRKCTRNMIIHVSKTHSCFWYFLVFHWCLLVFLCISLYFLCISWNLSELLCICQHYLNTCLYFFVFLHISLVSVGICLYLCVFLGICLYF